VSILLAVAYIFPSLFDEFEYNLEDGNGVEESAIEIGLDTFLEAINIFGSGFGTVQQLSERSAKRGWRGDRAGEDENDDEDGAHRLTRDTRAPGGAGGGGAMWGKKEKATMMTMTYEGQGYPVKLILCVTSWDFL
jgi:hypothetical protein